MSTNTTEALIVEVQIPFESSVSNPKPVVAQAYITLVIIMQVIFTLPDAYDIPVSLKLIPNAWSGLSGFMVMKCHI